MMKINGKLLEVEEHGAGDALIMVHGLGGTSNSWHPQVALLARSFRVIRLDLEGSGRSPAKGKTSIASFARDIATLMKKRQIKSAHLVGHSMGTIVCQHIAAKAPASVKSLALLGPLAQPPQPARGAIRERAPAARKEGKNPNSHKLVQIATTAENNTQRPRVAAQVRNVDLAPTLLEVAGVAEALAAAKSADLAKIKCPTLLITGDEDAVAPPAAVQKLGQAIKRAKVVILSGCGHWTPLEKPAEVNAALMNFYFA